MIGGYILVDATGAYLSTGGTVTGLYKKLQDAIKTGKFVLLTGVKYVSGGATYTPIPVSLTLATDVIYIDAPMGGYNVTSADVLSANA